MEQKKKKRSYSFVVQILTLCQIMTDHWTLCHINAGASSSLVVEHCARTVCLLLCLFWTGLRISCTFGLQPNTALISAASEMWFMCSSPSPLETSLSLLGTA